MTPGAAEPRATPRAASPEAGPGSSVARVSLALGVSAVLHVLGAVALWGGASEPECSRPGRPLEVELVWREAAGRAGSTGSGQEVPAPVRVPGHVSPPAPAGHRPEKVTATPQVGGESAAPGTERAEPPPEARARAEASPSLEPQAPAAVPSVGGLPRAEAPGGSGEGAPGSGPAQASQAGASGGGATGMGSSGGGSPGEGAEADVGAAIQAYLRQLSRHVMGQRHYPAQAMRLGMEGTAKVRVRLHRDGSLAVPPRLEGSSRFPVLDAEALRMVEAAAPFAPLPAVLLPREPAEFVIPVSFSLRAAAGGAG